MSRTAALGTSLALLLALASVGCGEPPQPKVAEQIKTVKAEEKPDKLLARGRAFAALGDNTRAEQYFSAAIDRGADSAVVLPLLLKVCIVEKRYRVAIDYAEPQLRRRPEDFRLRFVVASLYQTIGEFKTAREQLELVMKSRPDHADAHYALAVLFRDEDKDPVKADAQFREYLRLKPEGPHAEEARGSLLRDAGEAHMADPSVLPKTVEPPRPAAPGPGQLKPVPPPAPAPQPATPNPPTRRP